MLSKSEKHEFSNTPVESILLIKGEVIHGDVQSGATVKYRSRVKVDSTQPNLRQVHLIHYELIQELQKKEFNIKPSIIGENITTYGIELLFLPTGTISNISDEQKSRLPDCGISTFS